jgi:IS30 family transposase
MIPEVMQGRELSYPERQFLELRLLGRWSLRRIAAEMGRDHGVLSREVRRNARGGRYRAKEAQARCERMRGRKVLARKLDRDPALALYVEGCLRAGWSPEKIAGRTRSAKPPLRLRGATVSHETIYRWLYDGNGRFGGLTDLLWTRRRRRYARKGRKPKKAQIKGRVPVADRPEDGRPGHLESDSMTWRDWKGLLSAQVDRSTLVCRLRPCPDRTAAETTHALRRTAETLPHGFVRSVAFDNGSEGAGHLAFREEYGAMTYFCAPHAPWQKPQVENLNRTIRHWLPRKTKVSALTDRDWQDIEDRLNDLPRKSLGYLTPNEALNQYLASGALSS